MTIFVQINGINSVNDPRGHPQRSKCVKVTIFSRNYNNFDIGKLSTIKTTTTKSGKSGKSLKGPLNVQKWLKRCWKWIISTWNDHFEKNDWSYEETRRCQRLLRAEQVVRDFAALTGIVAPNACQYMDQQIRHLFYTTFSILIINNNNFKKVGCVKEVKTNIDVELGNNNVIPINVRNEQSIFEKECKNHYVNSPQSNENKVKRRTSGRTNAVSDSCCESKSDIKPLNKAVKANQSSECSDKRSTNTKHRIWSVISDQKVTRSVAMMISLTIYLMLIQQSVEINPGPCKARQTIKIITFNTNGLGDKMKLKRLLKKLEPVVNNGGLALLQETHIVKTDYLKLLWKNKFSSNCVSTNSAGVITLFNNDYEVVEEYSDNDGRALIVAIKSERNKYIV